MKNYQNCSRESREVKVNLPTLSHESFSGTVQSAVQGWFWPVASYRRQFVLSTQAVRGSWLKPLVAWGAIPGTISKTSTIITITSTFVQRHSR